MKHKLFALFVLIIFLPLTGETLAASKPPAKTCAQLIDMSDPGNLLRMTFVVKSAGSMKTADGSINTYAVHGFVFSQPGADKWNYPLVGTGHMEMGTDHFAFSLVGSTLFSGTFFSADMFGFWDVVDKSGVIYSLITGTKGGLTGDDLVLFVMTEIPCGAMEIPEPPTAF